MARVAVLLSLAACAVTQRPFELRAPVVRDTDLDPVSVPCRSDPSPKDPQRVTCAPREYVSPFIWDQVDNLAFARLSRGLSMRESGEAVNANSLDEVADSAWFTNRPRGEGSDDGAPGACRPEDLLSADVPDGAWTIDHGKDNGSSLGFRVDVPGKGRYMLKTDDPGHPEQATSASVIGAAFYDAIGYHTTCEQIVSIRRAQLKLKPGLTVSDNTGIAHPFDAARLDALLAKATQLPGGRVRMQASKWLPGLSLGPFRYEGTRDDDPNDAIDHMDRRELRGNRVLSAWLNHWDSREQNSMDIWLAEDPKHERCAGAARSTSEGKCGSNERGSPGHVMHYIIDTSDAMGALGGPYEMAVRLGYSYTLDLGDVLRAFVTLGIEERPWEHAEQTLGREKFGFFRVAEFDPDAWKGQYPNPAFLVSTERDAAWMARLIARFSPADVRRIVAHGAFSDPTDATYLAELLVARQRIVLARYLTTLSPLGEIHAAGGDRICATDFARLRELAPAAAFHYAIVERVSGREVALQPEPGPDGALCFRTQPPAPGERATITVRNGTRAGPLVMTVYGASEIAGVERPAP